MKSDFAHAEIANLEQAVKKIAHVQASTLPKVRVDIMSKLNLLWVQGRAGFVVKD